MYQLKFCVCISVTMELKEYPTMKTTRRRFSLVDQTGKGTIHVMKTTSHSRNVVKAVVALSQSLPADSNPPETKEEIPVRNKFKRMMSSSHPAKRSNSI